MSLTKRNMDWLTLIPTDENKPPTSVRVEVQRGAVFIRSLRRRLFKKYKVDSTHSLKTVWISDRMDEASPGTKNCFTMTTPEVSYILQADSHRSKIEWMRSICIAVSQSLSYSGSYKPSNWSNLADLQTWLLTREFTYQFQTHERYKGAEYSGKWTLGLPNIQGSMKWPSGDRYDGDFAHGKFEGSGTFMWFTHSHFRHYTGAWHDGSMVGHGEMLFVDQSSYVGWWRMGMRHGHGRMEYRRDNSSYVGGWEKDERCGYGVHDNRVSKERYLGMWKEDKYHGAGILMASNKFYFSGDFIHGERTYTARRSVRQRSRCTMQEFKWEPLFKAMGMLLEKMASTSHKAPPIGTSDFSNSFSKMTSPLTTSDQSNPTAVSDFPEATTSLSADQTMRGDCHNTLENEATLYPLCPGVSSELDGVMKEESCSVCRIEGFKSIHHPLGLLVSHLSKCFVDSYSGVAVHGSLLPHAVSEIFSTTLRVHELVRTYTPSLITRDENELLGRPKTRLSMLLKKNLDPRHTPAFSLSNRVDYTWLYPILLPAIYSTLFALYLEHYSQLDAKVDNLMSMLSRYDDEELSGLLQIRSIYEDWKSRGIPGQSFSNYLNGATKILKLFCGYSTPLNKLRCFQEVEQELTQLWIPLWNSGSFTGSREEEPCCGFSVVEAGMDEEDGKKLELLEETETESSCSFCSDSRSLEMDISASMETLKNRLSGTYSSKKFEEDLDSYDLREDISGQSRGGGDIRMAKSLGDFDKADLLVPPVGLFTFVLVRSSVRHLYCELQFIQDFAGSTTLQKDYGLLLTRLKDSYYQLMEFKKN